MLTLDLVYDEVHCAIHHGKCSHALASENELLDCIQAQPALKSQMNVCTAAQTPLVGLHDSAMVMNCIFWTPTCIVPMADILNEAFDLPEQLYVWFSKAVHDIMVSAP